MSLQDRFFPIVRQVASAFPHLLQINTYASCCEFTQRCLMAFGDPEWGHVGKTESEGQFTPPGFTPRDVVGVDGHPYRITGVSHDAIFHRATNQIVDLLGNGSANSDPDVSIHGPASIQWAEIPQSLNRVNNPWIPAIAVAGSTPATPAVPHSGIKSKEEGKALLKALDEFYSAADGLQRAHGLVGEDGRVDLDAVLQWFFQMVIEGHTLDDVKAQIRNSDEWKGKHP